jgi:hypothetical protein
MIQIPAKSIALLILAGFLASSVGCGGDNLGRQAVSGSVNVDGTPLQKGTINFQPLEKGVGSGASIEGGKYAMARKNGLPAGKYRVVINAPVPGTGGQADLSAPPGEPPPPPQELIPEDWNAKSEHTIEIKSGKNEHNFDVQAKKK